MLRKNPLWIWLYSELRNCFGKTIDIKKDINGDIYTIKREDFKKRQIAGRRFEHIVMYQSTMSSQEQSNIIYVKWPRQLFVTQVYPAEGSQDNLVNKGAARNNAGR